jgi:hypothetical protein
MCALCSSLIMYKVIVCYVVIVCCTQLPQIEDSLSSVTDLIVTGKIKDKVNNGLREFDKIQRDIQTAVKDLIPKISENMRRAGTAACLHCFLYNAVSSWTT